MDIENFIEGDIIGCGFYPLEASIFFTKNGKIQIPCMKEVVIEELSPAVGLKSIGTKVSFNFGEEEFKFDIRKYISDKMGKIITEVSKKQRIGQVNMNILNFLLVNGYKDTFEEFSKNTDCKESYETILNSKSKNKFMIMNRKLSEEVGSRFRSNSFQGNSSLRKIRSISGSQLGGSAIFQRRKGSFRKRDLNYTENQKILKILQFKKGTNN